MSFINRAKTALIKKVKSDRALQNDYLDKLDKMDLSDILMDYASLTGIVIDFECYAFYANIKKNRYNYYPINDNTLVKIESDIYINANYISTNLNNSTKFIAAEAPTSETANEFWSMIFEKNVTQIIMFGKINEEKVEKCFQYFPNGCEKIIGNFNILVLEYNEIIFQNEKNDALIIIERKFLVKNVVTNAEKEICHFHFKEWPESGIPFNSKPIIYLYQIVVAQALKTEPILVHCSDGLGRTGVFIGAYFIYELFIKNELPSIRDAVIKLRKQRNSSILNGIHFLYLHCLLIELLILKEPKLDKTKLMKLKTKYYQMLNESQQTLSKPILYRAISAPGVLHV